MKRRDTTEGCAIWFMCLILAVVLSVPVLAILCNTHVIHTWHTETFDEVEVKVCSKCGEIKKVDLPECKHNWDVRQEVDEFIAFCTKCGETTN